MHTVGTFEAKTHFSSLIEKVEQGEQIIITKHGHPVAKLSPVDIKSKESIRETIKSLEDFNQSFTLNGITWQELRDEGRK